MVHWTLVEMLTLCESESCIHDTLMCLNMLKPTLTWQFSWTFSFAFFQDTHFSTGTKSFVHANYLIWSVFIVLKANRGTQNCVAGETLSIFLGELSRFEATLAFSNQDYNLTLVDRGSPVGNSHPDFMGRIKLTTNSIEVLNVNMSDVGNYTLSDGLNRKVKIISMNLVGEFLHGISEYSQKHVRKLKFCMLDWRRHWTCELANFVVHHLQ